MQVLPGSQLRGQVPHGQKKDGANMFATGQSLEVPADAPIELLLLAPGEFSLHHTYLFHNSMPNRSDDRRIGLGISYIPTRCSCSSKVRLTASLARGTDRHGHFDIDPRPLADYDPDALAVHAKAIQRWNAARAELIPQAHSRAA